MTTPNVHRWRSDRERDYRGVIAWLCPHTPSLDEWQSAYRPIPDLTLRTLPRDAATGLRIEFARLAAEWKRDTAYLSSARSIALHLAYQRIIGMGRPALPLIFEELRREPGNWLWALEAITGVNPVPAASRGQFRVEVRKWLEWGNAEGY